MNRYPLRFFLIAAILLLPLLAACQPLLPDGAVEPTPAPAQDEPSAPAAPAEAPADANLPDAVVQVRDAFAGQLQLDPGTVAVASFEEVEWPDSCLGAPNPAEMCAMAITPGYRIFFEAGGDQYEVHSDLSGANFRLVAGPEAEVGDLLLDWVGASALGECQHLTIGSAGVAFGRCYTPVRLQAALSFGDRAGELEALLATFAPFTATTQAGDVTFNGTGSTEAAPSEQRMLAEWAQLVGLELAAGRTSNANGLLFAVLQQGGIGPRCTNLSVYLSGAAYASDCAGEVGMNYPAVRLDAAQLESIYGWYDTLAPFERVQAVGTADTMTTTTLFAGRGGTEATEDEKDAIEALAAELLPVAMAGEPMPAAPAEASASAADLSGCSADAEGQRLFASEAHGFCVTLPVDWSAVEYSRTGTAFVRGGDMMNSIDARLDINVEEAHEATAQMAADARITLLHQDLPDWVVDTEEITLGGEPAFELRALPGQNLQRVIYVTHGDQLYSIVLAPDDGNVSAYADMQTLYDALLATFAFTR